MWRNYFRLTKKKLQGRWYKTDRLINMFTFSFKKELHFQALNKVAGRAKIFFAEWFDAGITRVFFLMASLTEMESKMVATLIKLTSFYNNFFLF